MSTPGNLLFFFTAVVALLGAGITVGAKRPIRAAMALLLHIGALAAMYLTLSAHLLAALQLIVYAGAVVVLFIFVIMMIGPTDAPKKTGGVGMIPRLIAALFMGAVTMSVAGAVADLGRGWITVAYCDNPMAVAECEQFGGVNAVGKVLFNEAVVPFELVSILLLVAVLGAIAVARGRTLKEVEKLKAERARREAEDAAQLAYEQKLSAEVSAHGGH